jgi:hypothetical protein
MLSPKMFIHGEAPVSGSDLQQIEKTLFPYMGLRVLSKHIFNI